MSWNVIYTKSRAEKSVAEKLAQAGFEVYCPVLRTEKLWSDRRKWVEEPLFRSYCFVNATEQEREKVLFIPGVVRYVFYCGKPAVIRENEMEALRSWLAIYEHNSLIVTKYNVNDRIRFKSGALVDKEGAIIDTRGNYVTLYLEDLGLQVKFDLRKNFVEKV